ncbi:MAG: hypothetical protein PHX71_10570 [Synergistales bacterium]|nr:hypothetical protein [Synergistales bacterium]
MEGEAILAPLLFVTQDPAEIPFNELPEEYIVKPNDGRSELLGKVWELDRDNRLLYSRKP